jgi:uncharacterized iron-regulated membrane protein
MTRKQIRRLWLDVHLYLALSIGFLFVLLGLSGSLNVFRWDIDEWLNPELVAVKTDTPHRSPDEIFEAVHRVHPERGGSWSLEMPRHPKGMVMARHFSKTAAGDPEILFVSIDPYTAEIVANRFYGDFGFIITWIYKFHYSLFLGETGSNLVGGVGVLLLISLASGIYLWLPHQGNYKMAFSMKRRASAERLTFDLHRLSGLYAFPLLLVVAFTGTCMIFSDYVRPLVAHFSPVRGGFNPAPPPPEGLRSEATGTTPISLAEAAHIAQTVFPEAAVRFIKTPDGPRGFYGIQMRQPNEASQFFTTTTAWIDQYTGKVLAVRDPRHFSAGETFLNLLWSLHNGEIMRLPGRISVCLAGVIPLLLYLTGLIRWLQKRRVKSRIRSLGKVN